MNAKGSSDKSNLVISIWHILFSPTVMQWSNYERDLYKASGTYMNVRARRLHLPVQKQGERSDTSETITYKANDCSTPCIVQISLKSFQAAGITFCLS